MFWMPPDVEDWRYDTVQFKASHNSYARDAPLTGQMVFETTHPWWHGCRGLELDLRQSPSDHQVWSVDHDRFDPNRLFDRYLRRLELWSDRHPNHDPILLTLDLKKVYSNQGDFPGDLDAYLDTHFDTDRLLSPADVRTAAGVSWPTLGELRGRFLFCLSGSKGHKQAYASSGTDPLCFADGDVPVPLADRPFELPDDGRLFLNVYMGAWKERLDRLEQLCALPGFVVRAYYVNTDNWLSAQSAGVNIMATDEITHPKAFLNRLSPFHR